MSILFSRVRTRGQGLLELVRLDGVLHAKGVEVLGAPDLELGHATRLLDLHDGVVVAGGEGTGEGARGSGRVRRRGRERESTHVRLLYI